MKLRRLTLAASMAALLAVSAITLGTSLAGDAGAQGTSTGGAPDEPGIDELLDRIDELELENAGLTATVAQRTARIVELRAKVRVLDRRRATWKRRHHRVYRLLHPYSSSWLAAALCIKSEEGAWTSNTGNGYFGGFQMDRSFQRAYGARFYGAIGTADLWHPKQQLLTAYRGFVARGGWNPWPNTSRECGLPLFV